jgi:hypothetical protein
MILIGFRAGIICVGFALDAANRLAVELASAGSAHAVEVKSAVEGLLAASVLLNFECLSRAEPANWQRYVDAAKAAEVYHREHGYGDTQAQASKPPSARDNY